MRDRRREGFITGQDTDYLYNVDLERMIETVKNAKREERREKRLKIDVKLGRRQKLPSY
jgi:hypothetical protein